MVISNILVSVIVPVYKDWNTCLVLLDSLRGQEKYSEDIEVILINNGLNEDVPNNLKLMHNETIFHEEKLGSYAARNLGITWAKGKFLAFTDADCTVSKDWIHTLLLNKSKNESVICGHIELIYKSQKLSYVECRDKALAFDQLFNSNLKRCVTANMFVSKKIYEKVGFFDTNLKSGGDFEWCQRASKSGIKFVYDAQSVVFHPARHNMSQVISKSKRTLDPINLQTSKIKKFEWVLNSIKTNGLGLVRIYHSNKVNRCEKIKAALVEMILILIISIELSYKFLRK
jgi:GT2 family glycosyltransferase